MATANRANLIQQLYLLCSFNKRQPSSYFRKNQLSPSSIGISPLFTSHPRVLHGSWVRASFACYSKFTLLINSSPGFGSSPCHYIRPFRLAFTTTPPQSGLVNDIELTRWIVLQKARSHPDKSGLLLFVSIWFQILFHLPHRDTFHLSLTVLISLSITRNIQSWSYSGPSFKRDFSGPALLENNFIQNNSFSHTRLSLCIAVLSRTFC